MIDREAHAVEVVKDLGLFALKTLLTLNAAAAIVPAVGSFAAFALGFLAAIAAIN